MCLIALALDAHPRYALVIAANRDEFFERPTVPLDWWQPGKDAAPILSGRDLTAGGTWLGLARNGRIGMLTNVRAPERQRADAPSRGALVPAWLGTQDAPAAHWPSVLSKSCNPFNLIGGDLATGQWWWGRDDSAQPHPMGRGVFGLSNAALDTPWPKVQGLKQTMQRALAADDETAVVGTLFAALADDRPAADAELPDTGVGLERERWLSPAYIRTPDGRYGTRCSTLVLGQREGTGWRLAVSERSFDAQGSVIDERRVDWTWRAPLT